MVKIQRMRRENTKSDTSDGSETNSDMIGVFDDVISGSEGQNQAQNEIKNVIENVENSTIPSPEPSLPSLSSSATIDPEEPEECPNCHKMVDPYDKNTHPSCCSGTRSL